MIDQDRRIKLVLARPQGSVLIDAVLDPPINVKDPLDEIYGITVENLGGWCLAIYVSNIGKDAGLPVVSGEVLAEHPQYSDMMEGQSELSPHQRLLAVISGNAPAHMHAEGWWEPSDAGRIAVLPLDKFYFPNRRLLVREVYFTREAYK